MEVKSTRDRAQKIISEINMQDHTQLSIDKFLAMEQLIGELSQEDIDFNKLKKYGCPSDFISCVFECKGKKMNATQKMCAKCWENALTEDIHVDTMMDKTPVTQEVIENKNDNQN